MGRDKGILIRVSQKELDQIRDNAKNDPLQKSRNKEVNVSNYIRARALHSKDYTEQILMANELRNINYEIRKIGINVNQVTKKINSGFGTALDIENLEDELKSLDLTFKELKGGLLNGDYKNHDNRGNTD